MHPGIQSKNLFDVLESIHSLHMQLFDFHRNFDWTLEKGIALLDSVRRGHQINLLHVWDIYLPKKNVHYIPFRNEKRTDNVIPKELVIDGQKRLTALYCFFYNKFEKTYYIDIKKLYELLIEDLEMLSGGDLQSHSTPSKEHELLQFLKETDVTMNDIIYGTSFVERPHMTGDLLPLTALRTRTTYRKEMDEYIERIKEKSSKNYLYFVKWILPSFFEELFDFTCCLIRYNNETSLFEISKAYEKF